MAPGDEIPIDESAHNTQDLAGESVYSPLIQGAREFVELATARE